MFRFLVFSLFFTGAASASATVPVTLERIESALEQGDVSHHWIAGKHVDWLTGDPDGNPVSKTGHHTHCSAFVASVCRHLDVPILEPPQHPQELLADAQCDWLISEAGVAAGWRIVEHVNDANRNATNGKLVLAVYHSPNETQPGHIAIVVPSARTPEQIQLDGPDITQAGLNNYARTTLRIGFKNHPQAWQEAKEVRFFVYK